MLLTLDIGNTMLTFGVFNNTAGIKKECNPLRTWKVATDANKLPDEYGLLVTNLMSLEEISTDDIDAVVLCSVVPPLTPSFVELSKSYFGLTPMVIGPGLRTGIRILYDSPRDVGADRIADAAATLKIYGGPAIIVDFGTATVFDAISENGDYLGGALVPGITVAAEALFNSASQLRKVELERPLTAIGKNTIHAIQSGLILGYTDMVSGMVKRFNKELGGKSKVVATGGLASIMAEGTNIFDIVNQNLTLQGLQIIHEMNS
jgi:type III pantothenate kinase